MDLDPQPLHVYFKVNVTRILSFCLRHV